MIEENQDREHLSKLDSDGIHSQVMKELAYVIARPLPIMFKQS